MVDTEGHMNCVVDSTYKVRNSAPTVQKHFTHPLISLTEITVVLISSQIPT